MKDDTLLVESSGLDPGDRVRIMYKKDGIRRPFFWLKVGKAGHIYFGCLVGKPTGFNVIVDSLDLSPDEQQKSVSWEKGVEWPGSRFKKGSRVSWKANGHIHFANERFQSGVSLSNLRSKVSLCAIRFANPTYYETPRERKENEYDVIIEEVDRTREGPKMGILNVNPTNRVGGRDRLIGFNTAEDPQRLVFFFVGLEKTPPLALELELFYTGIPDEWADSPEIMVISWPP